MPPFRIGLKNQKIKYGANGKMYEWDYIINYIILTVLSLSLL